MWGRGPAQRKNIKKTIPEVHFLMKYTAINSACPEVELRFGPWLQLFQNGTGGYYLSSFLCLLLHVSLLWCCYIRVDPETPAP